MAFFSSLFSALIMWPLIWWLSRKEASVSLRPVLLICLGVTGASFFALNLIGAWGLAVVIIGLIWALIHWCFLSWPKAILVAIVWFAFQGAFGTWISPIF